MVFDEVVLRSRVIQESKLRVAKAMGMALTAKELSSYSRNCALQEKWGSRRSYNQSSNRSVVRGSVYRVTRTLLRLLGFRFAVSLDFMHSYA